MKLRSVELFGVGKHHGFVLSALGDGLTVVYGDNEAGKSTLLAGVRGVLFGRTVTEEPQLQLARGAEGRVVVEDATGQTFVIERVLGKKASPRITGPDGSSVVGQEALKNLFSELQTVEDTLFQSVFTIQLSELTDLAKAHGPLQSRFYTVGLLGKKAPAEVEASFMAKARGIFNPDRRAKSPRLNQCLKEMDHLAAQLRSNRDTLRAYEELAEQLLVKKEEHAEAENVVHEKHVAWVMAQKDQEAFPLQRQLDVLTERLRELPPVSLTDAHRQQLDGLNREITSSYERIQNVGSELEKLEQRLVELEPDSGLLLELPVLRRMRAESSGILEQAKNLHVRLEESQALHSGIAELRIQLEEDWTDAEIAGLTLSVATLDAAEQARRRLDALETECGQARRDLLNQEFVVNERKRPLKSTDGTSWTRVNVDAQLAILRQRMDEIQDLLDRIPELTRLQEGFEEKSRSRDAAERRHREAARHADALSRGAGSALIVAVCAVAAVTAGVWAETAHSPLLGGLILLLGLALAGTATFQWRLAGVSGKSKRIDVQVMDEEDELGRIRDRLRKFRKPFGRSDDFWAQEDAIQQLRSELREAMAGEMRRHEKLGQVGQQLHELGLAETEYRRLDLECRRSQAELEQARAEWQKMAERTGRRFRDRTPSAFLAEASRLRQLQEAMLSLQRVERPCNEWTESIQLWLAELTELLHRLGATPAWPETAAAGRTGAPDRHIVEQALQRLNQALELATSHEQIQADLTALQREKARMTEFLHDEEARLASLCAEKEALFGQLRVTDDDAFARRVALEEERRDAEVSMRAIRSQLHGMYGGTAIYDGRTTGLRESTEQSLEETCAGYEQAYRAGRQRVESIIKEIGEMEQRMQRWQSGSGATDLNWQLATAEADRTVLARQWAVYTWAAHFVREARDTYERAHRPKALSAAASVMERVTAGRYVDLQARADTRGDTIISCVDKQGRAWPLQELSRGTREQVYLALRFAVIQDYAERGIYLPVVLDDVMVNFDLRRLQAFLDVIRIQSRRTQVICLTCQRGLVDAVKDMQDVHVKMLGEEGER